MLGLQTLHNFNPQILHRDVKSMNFLVTENWCIKGNIFNLNSTWLFHPLFFNLKTPTLNLFSLYLLATGIPLSLFTFPLLFQLEINSQLEINLKFLISSSLWLWPRPCFHRFQHVYSNETPWHHVLLSSRDLQRRTIFCCIGCLQLWCLFVGNCLPFNDGSLSIAFFWVRVARNSVSGADPSGHPTEYPIGMSGDDDGVDHEMLGSGAGESAGFDQSFGDAWEMSGASGRASGSLDLDATFESRTWRIGLEGIVAKVKRFVNARKIDQVYNRIVRWASDIHLIFQVEFKLEMIISRWSFKLKPSWTRLTRDGDLWFRIPKQDYSRKCWFYRCRCSVCSPIGAI